MIFSAEYLIAQPEPQLTTNDGCWLSIPFLSFSYEEEIDLSLIDRLAFSLLSFMLFPLQPINIQRKITINILFVFILCFLKVSFTCLYD